jgi:hypothetical protein
MAQSEKAKAINKNHCDGDCERCGLRGYDMSGAYYCDVCKCSECCDCKKLASLPPSTS